MELAIQSLITGRKSKMARDSSQKLKLLYVMQYLLRNSDEAHPVTVNQIIGYLNDLGIPAERL